MEAKNFSPQKTVATWNFKQQVSYYTTKEFVYYILHKRSITISFLPTFLRLAFSHYHFIFISKWNDEDESFSIQRANVPLARDWSCRHPNNVNTSYCGKSKVFKRYERWRKKIVVKFNSGCNDIQNKSIYCCGSWIYAFALVIDLGLSLSRLVLSGSMLRTIHCHIFPVLLWVWLINHFFNAVLLYRLQRDSIIAWKAKNEKVLLFLQHYGTIDNDSIARLHSSSSTISL